MSEFTPFHRGGSGPPLVLLHGLTGTWDIWSPIIGQLEENFEVFAPTLPAHAGGPVVDGELNLDALVNGAEAMLDEAGIETAHLVGNSLGGYVALRLAARGRARSVNVISPAGGWEAGDPMLQEAMNLFQQAYPMTVAAAENVDEIVASEEGRAMVLQFVTERPDIVSAETAKIVMLASARCSEAVALAEMCLSANWSFDLNSIDCPTRIVWGTADKVLAWPGTAVRYREGLSDADWVVLDGVGHCPMLDLPEKTIELITGFATD